MKKTFIARLLATAITLAAVNAQAQGTAAAAAPAGLYAAFGERTGIAALMDDFVLRLKADKRTAPFFEKSNLSELARGLTEQYVATCQ